MNTGKQFLIGAGAFALLAAANVALAQAGGVDTGASSLNNVKQWLMTWIPAAATIIIIAMAIAWMTHLIHAGIALRVIVGLIVVGSASYIVGLFQLA